MKLVLEVKRIISRFCLRNVAGMSLAPSTTYTIRVALLYHSLYYDFGDACSFTTAAVLSRTVETGTTPSVSALAEQSIGSVFAPVPYPNPFVDTFRISLPEASGEMIHALVYDFLGKLLYKQVFFASEFNTYEFGNSLPSGDYLLVVSQGASIKSMHINKK